MPAGASKGFLDWSQSITGVIQHDGTTKLSHLRDYP
jgi:hypothetical protein